jgi:hypothetical protein
MVRRLSFDAGATVSFGPRLDKSMVPGMNQEANDGGFPKGLACLQSMQTFDEDQSFSVPANEYRSRLPELQHALGDVLNRFRIERLTSLYRYVDLIDRKGLILQHGRKIQWTGRVF